MTYPAKWSETYRNIKVDFTQEIGYYRACLEVKGEKFETRSISPVQCRINANEYINTTLMKREVSNAYVVR